MDDHPVPRRIRGKRYRSGEKVARKKGTSLLRANRRKEELARAKSSKVSKQPHTSQHHSETTTQHDSHVLPTEIIQHIFAYSFNPGLLLVCTKFHSSLAHLNTLKTRLVQLSFGPRPIPDDIDNDLICPFTDSPYWSSKTQNWLLRLRWLTFPFLAETLAPTFQPHDRDLPFSTPPAPESQLPLHPRTIIPRKLLHGPWDAAKLDFLRTLQISGARIDEGVHSTDMETLSHSLMLALRDSNEGLTEIKELLPHDFDMPIPAQRDLMDRGPHPSTNATTDFRPSASDSQPTQYSTDTSRSIGQTNRVGCEARVVGPVLTTEHLRAAVIERDSWDDTLMWHLFTVPAEKMAVDRRDRAVWAWISRRKAEGDERAEWLEWLLRNFSITRRENGG